MGMAVFPPWSLVWDRGKPAHWSFQDCWSQYPWPSAGHCWPLLLLETSGHSQASLLHLLWGHCSFLLDPGVHKVLLCPPRVCLKLIQLYRLWLVLSWCLFLCFKLNHLSSFCFQLNNSYHNKGSGKWSSTECQINFTKVNIQFPDSHLDFQFPCLVGYMSTMGLY